MIAAVDIGGTNIKLGLIEHDNICCEKVIKTNPNLPFERTMESIEMAILYMLSQVGKEKTDLDGIGIGFPGIVDSIKLKVLSANKKFNDAISFDFEAWGNEKFKTIIAIENDARMALLGEWQFGAGKGVENICMLTFGTGIGTATIIKGEMLLGKHFQAGNLGGHFIVDLHGALCTCGNIGCAEAQASTWMLGDLVQSDARYPDSDILGKELNFETLFNLAAQGDKLSNDIKLRCLEVWTACIINQIHAYDPELVILGGGIMKSAGEIIPFIQNKVNERAWTPWGKVKIIESEIPNRSALLGASYWMKNKLNDK